MFLKTYLRIPSYRDGFPPGYWSALRSRIQPCEVKMPDVPDNNLLLTGEGYVTQPAELDNCDCFEPFISQVSVSPVPKPAPKLKPLSLMPVIDREIGRASCRERVQIS